MQISQKHEDLYRAKISEMLTSIKEELRPMWMPKATDGDLSRMADPLMWEFEGECDTELDEDTCEFATGSWQCEDFDEYLAATHVMCLQFRHQDDDPVTVGHTYFGDQSVEVFVDIRDLSKVVAVVFDID